MESKLPDNEINVSNTNETVHNEELLGFGEHCSPADQAKLERASRIANVALAILCINVIAIAVVLSPFVSVPVVALTVAAMATSGGLSTMFAIGSIIHYRRVRRACIGITNDIKDLIRRSPVSLGKDGKADVIPCQDTKESFEWKKTLIEAAEHNIVLSGNYCGGNSFDEILELIQKQMDAKDKLEVVILSSGQFVTPSNKEKLKELSEKFPDRFQFIKTPNIWHVNPGLKKTTNHSKILAVDYGKYFLLGGSGLEDKYAYAKGLGDRGDKEAAKVEGALGFFLPRGFRDQDFVFHSSDPEGVGRRVYTETLKLGIRWTGITIRKKGDSSVEAAELSQRLILEAPPETVTTRIQKFHWDKSLAEDANTKIFCIGPEHTHNPFEAEIIKRFDEAKDQIVIDHMFFHPSQKVFDALVRAGNRGVKIVVVTNKYDAKSSPLGHQFFAPRSKKEFYNLYNAVNPECRENLEFHEFNVRKTTLHKKVIVVDDYVIAGSSNFGYKSLVTMSDHEMNFVTKSKKLANRTIRVIQEDQENSTMSVPKRVSVSTRVAAFRHKLMAPLIG